MTTLKPEPSLEKGKPKGRAGRTFPVSFVVDQQLEACLDAIKRTENQPDFMIKVPYNARKDDRMAFSAILFQDGVAIHRIKGTLRRWEGTSTRVEATITMVNPLPESSNASSNEWMMLGVMVYYIVMLGILSSILPHGPDYQYLDIIGVSIHTLSLIPIGLLVHRLRSYRVQRKHIRLLRDTLTTDIESGATL